MMPAQRAFDDLGTALVDTTFCVLDLETTGGSPRSSKITEIGAVKVRGGEVLGEFQTLVNPHEPIPPSIVHLTGITDQMVAGAPPIEAALPAFLEFLGEAVLVAHNASFDAGFLRAVTAELGYPRPENPVVCTVRLARRLVRDEVPNLQLATLAHAMRARTEPSHRALADARATADVFHALLELAGRWGVRHVDDLLWFQGITGHPSYRKIRLTDTLPRARGVYLFRDGSGRLLYVGKATDLRARVRQYFSGDDRRRTGDLLAALASIDHLVCETDLEASVLEARLIRRHAPPFNRAQRGRSARWFLRLTQDRFPRLSRSRSPADDCIGPLPSRAADALREAMEDASEIRTCTARIGGRARVPVCVRGQVGRCPAPCDARVDPEGYAAVVEPVAAALRGDPSAVLDALGARMERLSEQARFEEAATIRERIGTIAGALRSARAIASLAAAGRVVVAVGEDTIELTDGFMTGVGGHAPAVDADGHPDEQRLVAAWLARNLHRVRLVACDRGWAMPAAGGAVTAGWSDRLRRASLVR